MEINTFGEFLFFALAVYGAGDLGHKFQRWVNS